MKKLKTIVYIDGFNLYYCALKNTKNKWLDLNKLCLAVMPDKCEIVAINYYTARVSGRIGSTAARDQNAYIQALQTLTNLRIHFGKFLSQDKWMFLSDPLKFRPEVSIQPQPKPKYAYVIKTEEKGSDVNLGVHLVKDACQNNFDTAAVITNDTDLMEPIRIVTQEMGKKVTLITPVIKRKMKPSESLVKVSSNIRHLENYLSSCQFSGEIIRPDGKIIKKPEDW